MVRSVSIIAATGLGILAACGSAWAGPEISLAAIATGRLYIVGTTERPHMPVLLEGQFRTESDDVGRFQYELIYHPARCIVTATIDGKAVEAVVGNCSQHCAVIPQSAATGPASAAAPLPAMPGAVRSPAAAGPPSPRSPQRNPATVVTPPARAGASTEPNGQPAGDPKRVQIERPPRPPQRPVTQAPPQARAVQPAKPARKPRPTPREAPDDAGPPIAD